MNARPFPVRGAIQRIAEVIQFTGVTSRCYVLSKNMMDKYELSEGGWEGPPAEPGLGR